MCCFTPEGLAKSLYIVVLPQNSIVVQLCLIIPAMGWVRVYFTAVEVVKFVNESSGVAHDTFLDGWTSGSWATRVVRAL